MNSRMSLSEVTIRKFLIVGPVQTTGSSYSDIPDNCRGKNFRFGGCRIERTLYKIGFEKLFQKKHRNTPETVTEPGSARSKCPLRNGHFDQKILAQ